MFLHAYSTYLVVHAQEYIHTYVCTRQCSNVRTLHVLVTSQVGCAANTIILFLDHRGRQPEVNKENCDCMAAHPTWEGYN